jgi:Swi5-dependent recombination DNA repair protein 1
MSSPSAAKRRRLKYASTTLQKPFVSPLRRTQQIERQPSGDSSNRTSLAYTPSTLAHTIEPSSQTGAYLSPAASGELENKLSAQRRSARPLPHLKPATRDAAEVAAQRALTALELQIRALRNDIDALAQSHSILCTVRNPTAVNLDGLADKWRLASQQAAEELFGAVKERVQRMGGLAAWRESERKKYDRAHGLGDFQQAAEESNDDDCEFDSQGEELPSEEVEFRKGEKRRVRQEARDAADLPGGEDNGQILDNRVAKARVWAEEGRDDDVSVSA